MVVDAGAAEQHIELAQRMARESLSEARRSVWNLRAPALERANLADALRSIVARPVHQGISTTFEQRGDPWPLSPDAEAALLRATQEALANCAKHAQASQLVVILEYLPDRAELVVTDNGVGFEQDALASATVPSTAGGLGLVGMRERLTALGGTLALRNVEAGGAQVRVSVPR
jgi:signal transduction histidine kinase